MNEIPNDGSRQINEVPMKENAPKGLDAALLPCPFCDHCAQMHQVPYDPEDTNSGGYYIECDNPACGATTALRFSCGEDCRPMLREQWSRRAPPTPADGALQADARGLFGAAVEVCEWIDNRPMGKPPYDEIRQLAGYALAQQGRSASPKVDGDAGPDESNRAPTAAQAGSGESALADALEYRINACESATGRQRTEQADFELVDYALKHSAQILAALRSTGGRTREGV